MPAAVRQLASQRWRIAIAMTAAMMAVYFGFILLVAFAPNWLGHTLTPGLSFGIALGMVVIFTAWLLTLLYVRWANRVYDPALSALRSRHAAGARTSTDSTEKAGTESEGGAR